MGQRSLGTIAAVVGVVLAGLACGLGMTSSSAPSASTASGVQILGSLTSNPPGSATAEAEYGLVPQATAAVQPTTAPVLSGPPSAIPEYRRLTLEYPARIRAGDADVVRLTLEVDTLGGITPTAEVAGNLVTGGIVQVPDLYQTHYVVAEADLDLAGVDFQPRGPVSEPLLPGESVTFRWSVHPTAPGSYRGTAWLFLVFTDKVTGAQSRKAISAQPIEIDATTFFGLGGDAARLAGGLGAVGGGVLGLPFADDLVKWIWKRMRRRTQ